MKVLKRIYRRVRTLKRMHHTLNGARGKATRAANFHYLHDIPSNDYQNESIEEAAAAQISKRARQMYLNDGTTHGETQAEHAHD